MIENLSSHINTLTDQIIGTDLQSTSDIRVVRYLLGAQRVFTDDIQKATVY